MKTKSQPFAQRDSDPHTNINRESTSQKHHSMFALFLFPLVNIYFCPTLLISPYSPSQPSLQMKIGRTRGKEEHGEIWPQTGKSQQSGYSCYSTFPRAIQFLVHMSASTVSQAGIGTCAWFHFLP